MWIKKPYITIITPTYNRADLLEHAILSVINQKQDIPFDREMIITDDWSKDWTKNIVQKHITMYPKNIKYFYQENSWIPGNARNRSLDNMSKISDYVIFLDSDDELKLDIIYTALKKWEELRKKWEYDKILWFYFLCEDENGWIIGDKKILEWKKEIKFNYQSFLQWKLDIEMLVFLKSDIFIWEPHLRFEKDTISEWVLWSRMYKYMYKKWFEMLLRDCIWRIYKLNHISETRIIKTISKERFKRNAIWNERVLDIIWEDMLKYWYTNNYSDYLFRTGINRVLYWSKKEWIIYLRQSLKYKTSIKNIVVYVLSLFSKRLLLFVYKMYI